MTQRLTPRIAFLLTLPPLLWAGNAVVGRLAVGVAPPIALNFSRWLLAFLLLYPLGRAALQDRAVLRQRWRYLAALGLLGMGSYNAFQYLALHTSTPLNATLISASSPVWMLAIGALAYGERPRRAQLLGALLSLAGVAVVLGRGEVQALRQVQFVPGDLIMLCGIVSWCVYSWLLAKPPPSMRPPDRPDWHWSEFLAIQIGLGLVWASAFAGLGTAWAPAAHGLHHVAWTPALIAAVAYVGVLPSLVAYRLWGLGVAQAGPTVAAFFANLTPLFAALLGAAMLGEWPQPFHGLAFGLIVAGIVVSARR